MQNAFSWFSYGISTCNHFRIRAQLALILFITCCAGANTWAQDNEVSLVEIKVVKANKGVAGAKAVLTRDGKKVDSQTSSKNGKFDNFILMDNGNYRLELTLEGHYGYIYTFHTKVGAKDAERLDGFPPTIVIEAELYEKVPGFDAPLFQSPIMHFAYNASAGKGEIAEDKSHTAKVNKRKDEYVKAFGASKEEQQKLIEEIKKKEAPPTDSPAKNDGGESNKGNAPPTDTPPQEKQETFHLNVTGRITEVGHPVPEAFINVKSYASQLSLRNPIDEKTITCQGDGTFDITLDLGRAYIIQVFQPGHHAKSYFIDATGKSFTKSYIFKLDVELLKTRSFKDLELPPNLNKEYENIDYNKRADVFAARTSYYRNPEVKALRDFFDELHKRWDQFYKKNGRAAPPPPEPEKKTETAEKQPPAKEPAKEEEKKPLKTEESKPVYEAKSALEKEAEARRNKALAAEEERRIQAELERQEKAAREAEERRLRELEEAEQQALVEKMIKDAEASAVMHEQAKKTAEKEGAARQVQAAKKAGNINITQELAKIEREEKIAEASKSKKPATPAGTRATIKPKITEELEDGYVYDTRIITVQFPGRKIIIKEVTSLWGGKTYFINDEEIDEDRFSKELAKYNIK